ALYKAVIGLHLRCCQILIQKAEHLVNSKDLSWRTPLHDAASWGSLPIVEMLLRHDAHIDAQTRKGQTPLYLSILQGHSSVAELLVKKGASLQIINTNKRWTALHLAAWTGSLVILEMLIENGADVDAQDRQGYTALHVALQEGHGGIVDYL
ncbi:ankyrin repeat-containing domain protein, partial [Colletotrichum acutatum]